VVLAINELSKKKRALRITYTIGKIRVGTLGQLGAVFVKVLNNGPRPVEIVNIGVFTKNKSLIGVEKAYEKVIA